jgi:hypothetical protein
MEAQPTIVNPMNTLIEGQKFTVFCQQQLSIRNGGSGGVGILISNRPIRAIVLRDGEMGTRDGEMGRWRDGEMERWGDGEMGRWRDGERWGQTGSAPFSRTTNQYLPNEIV